MKTPFFKGFALAAMLAAEEVSYRLGGFVRTPPPCPVAVAAEVVHLGPIRAHAIDDVGTGNYQGAKAFFTFAQRCLHLGDDIRPLAGEQVQQLQYALMRSMRFSVMRREDAYGFSRTGKEGGGLNRSYAYPTRHFDGRGPSKSRALFNMLNDNAFSPPKRCAAGALTRMSSVPEVKPPLRKTAMMSDLKV